MRDYAEQQTAILLRRFTFQVSRTAKAGNAESIHDLRVAIRRLSRCLAVFSQFFPHGAVKKIRTQLSELMDVAGAVRDRDAALEILPRAGVDGESPILVQLRAERRRLAAELEKELRRWKSRNFWRKWRSRLELERS